VLAAPFFWPIGICRNRRLAKDYERKVQTSETLIEVAAIRLLLKRIAGTANLTTGSSG
jgi:hypothetical protein